MTASNAAQYADSLIATIRANAAADAPFGWVHTESDDWTDERPDGWVTPDEDPDDNGETECAYHAASAGDYLSDILDIQYLVSSTREYRSAQVFVTLGGPTAYIDTEARELVVVWGDRECRALPLDFCDGLDDYLDEMWQAGA